jgi:hypothetical protein
MKNDWEKKEKTCSAYLSSKIFATSVRIWTRSTSLSSFQRSNWSPTYILHLFLFNVYRNQLSWLTGSRNPTGPKTLPTIWYTYMMLVTKYQISAINSYWEKCDKKYLGQTEGRTDRWTEVKQYVGFLLPVSQLSWFLYTLNIYAHFASHFSQQLVYWWQRSDIWSQASYRYPISWEAFLDPSDSYFLFAIPY